MGDDTMSRASFAVIGAAFFGTMVFSCLPRTVGTAPPTSQAVQPPSSGPVSTLGFRILAEATDDGAGEFDAYRSALAKNGPTSLGEQTKYRWFRVWNQSAFFNKAGVEDAVKYQHLVVGSFGGDCFVLAHVDEGYVLTNPRGTGWSLQSVRVTKDGLGRPAIGFSLDERGAAKMRGLTSRNRQRQLGIFLGDEALTHATISSAVGADALIEGSFTQEETSEVAKLLEAGIGR
jgi:hypothetical protein